MPDEEPKQTFFDGVKVKQADAIRKEARDSDVHMIVAKKSLLRKTLKENNLSEKHGIEDVEYVSLEEFREDEEEENKPLFLVFYLNKELFKQEELVSSYGANVKKYLDEKGDNVRLFFMPTEHNEKIVCINPLYIGDEKEYEKLNTLIGELEEKFQLEVD